MRGTALVLSAGGMFGAYQAGVWQALDGVFRPDLVVGASVGALNGWAIAGGATAQELTDYWLDPVGAGLARLRFPLAPWRGVFDSEPLHARIRTLWAAYRPRVPVGIAAAELPGLRLRIFTEKEIGWEHLAASCAVLFGYRQMRIDGKYFTDGGLLSVLPVGAAAAMGATRIIAVNALPLMPSATVRLFVRCVRRLAPNGDCGAAAVEIHTISPSVPLGSLKTALTWHPDNVKRWMAMGAQDGARFVAGADWMRTGGGYPTPSPVPGRQPGI